MNHRTLLKILFNPILRRFGVSIVSIMTEDGKFIRYTILPYPQNCPIKRVE